MSGVETPDREGFGIAANINGKATKADRAAATKLLGIVRAHLGTAHPFAKRGRTSAWADH